MLRVSFSPGMIQNFAQVKYKNHLSRIGYVTSMFPFHKMLLKTTMEGSNVNIFIRKMYTYIISTVIYRFIQQCMKNIIHPISFVLIFNENKGETFLR